MHRALSVGTTQHSYRRLSAATVGVDEQIHRYNTVWIMLAFGYDGDVEPRVSYPDEVDIRNGRLQESCLLPSVEIHKPP